MTSELIEQVARAVHEHICRRNVMQYLDNDEDCEGIAKAAIEAVQANTAEQDAELAKFKALAETLAGALDEWDELIKHPYFGSRKAMSDMNYAAQRGLKALLQYKEARDAS